MAFMSNANVLHAALIVSVPLCAAGEALAHVVGSVPVSRDQVLRSNFTSLAGERGA